MMGKFKIFKFLVAGARDASLQFIYGIPAIHLWKEFRYVPAVAFQQFHET